MGSASDMRQHNIEEERKIREVITGSFFSLVGDQGYSVLQEGAERHGSWEWIASKRDQTRNLNRYVVLALTEDQPGLFYAAEGWAGADDGERFCRLLVKRDILVYPGYFLENIEPINLIIRQTLERANFLTFDDLRETYTYLPPRSLERGDEAT